MKKLFALLAVAALAAVGCDDKKSTGKPADKTTPTTPAHVTTEKPAATTTEKPAATTTEKPAATTTTKPETKKPDGPGLPDGKDKPKGDGK